MYQDFFAMIIKSFCINLYTYMVFFKIYDIKRLQLSNKVIIGVFTIVATLIYALLDRKVDNMFIIIILFFVKLIPLSIINKRKINSLLIGNFVSNAMVYIGFAICSFIEIPIKIIFDIEYYIIDFLIILLFEYLFILEFFKLKRFSKGFTFLKDKSKENYLDIIMINISAFVMLAYCLFGDFYGDVTEQLLVTFIVITIIMLSMIQKSLTLYYKQKLLHQTIEDYKNEIAEKDKKIKELSDEKYKISKLNHEFYNRQKALEKKVADYVSNINMEAGTELAITDKISELSKEYTSKLQNIKHPDKLPKAEIEEIDDMFKYMQSECEKNKIEFKLEINGNIHHMINKIIPKDKLVTLIGDHLRDAIIAINASDNKFKSIIAILGKTNEYYEFCVLDTGIEFEVETLLQLGTKPITTHKDTGGTGYGFMTTFETLKSTKGSLEIEEKHKMNENDYTKAVRIIFDGKAQYRIKSYRLGTKEKSIL